MTTTSTAGVARHADDMALVLDTLGLGRVPVVGMSMGGYVGLELADRHPHGVASLVLVDRDDPLLRRYVEQDLLDGQVRLSADALVSDATDVFFGQTPWEDIGVPIRFLHAEWGIGRDSAPASPPDAVQRYAALTTTVVGVDGVDHAGSIMSPTGARATAALVREAVA